MTGLGEPTLANPTFDPDIRRAGGQDAAADEEWRGDDGRSREAGVDNNRETQPETPLRILDGADQK
jgi:hypothetical protein